MTASHNKNHIARAALEACAYQTKDVFEKTDDHDKDVRNPNLFQCIMCKQQHL